MTKTLSLTDSPIKTSRRFRELTTELAETLGGVAALNSVETSMVHSAAALMVRLEQMQERLVAGEDIDPNRMVRLSSEARRALTILRRAKGTKKHFNGADPLTDLKTWADFT